MVKKSVLFDVFNDAAAIGVALKNKSLKRAIIGHFDQSGNATITDLVQELNISYPKTTSLINDLIQDGLIHDYGKIDSTGGRPANMYGLRGEACYFIGVDINHFYINLGLLDFNKNLILVKINHPFLLNNTPAVLDELIALVNIFIKDSGVSRKHILGICFNLPGRINSETGHSYDYFHFYEQPLSKTIEGILGIKTYLENDSRAMVYGEFHNGTVTTEKNILFVNLDYGIGLGIIIDGKIYYGKSGFGGEFGHIPIFTNEIICHCGKKGCLETEASGQAILRLFKEKTATGSTSAVLDRKTLRDDLRLADIINACKNDDMLCIELIEQTGEKIGKGIAMLLNIFNPEMVVLGGILTETGDYIYLPIRSALNKYSLSLVNSDTQLCISSLGSKVGVIGGCLMARSKLIQAFSG
ncbi:MAG: ROK family protein [Chitinophagaceae bacterium]|nr:ROK family protein [Chitinophagaceae bacterium]